MVGLAEILFKSGGVWLPVRPVTPSIFSEEFMASSTPESSDSWITISSDDDDDFFSADSGSIGEAFEARTVCNILKEGLRVAAEVDGEARLARVISWVARGYNTLDIEEASWLLEGEGESEPSEGRDIGRDRLEKWMKVMEVRKRQRERALRKERWRKPWTVIASLMGRGSDKPVSLSNTGEIQRSYTSDEVVVKKGDKFFRARRRMMNVFRRVDKPVESAIASKRFLID